MKNLRTIDVHGNAPEDTLFDGKGHVFTGLKDGNAIVKIDIASGRATVIAEPGGRPLGLDWLPDGRILICNSELGLQAVNIASGRVEALPIKGARLHLCNNAHALSDGTILVSDSSTKFDLDNYAKDLIQNTSTGRLLKIAPDGTAEVLLVISIKTNVIGTFLIAVASSFATVAFGIWMQSHPYQPIAKQPAYSSAATSPNVLECSRGIYSPVQRRCVDQTVFDGEMKRLFEALGLRADVYEKQRQAHDE